MSSWITSLLKQERIPEDEEERRLILGIDRELKDMDRALREVDKTLVWTERLSEEELCKFWRDAAISEQNRAARYAKKRESRE